MKLCKYEDCDININAEQEYCIGHEIVTLKAENVKLKKLVILQDKLLVCYRIGKHPPAYVLDGLASLRKFKRSFEEQAMSKSQINMDKINDPCPNPNCKAEFIGPGHVCTPTPKPDGSAESVSLRYDKWTAKERQRLLDIQADCSRLSAKLAWDHQQDIIDRQAGQIEAYKKCSKDHKEKCSDVKCWVQVLRDEQMSTIDRQAGQIKAINTKLLEWESREGAVCPEDVGFEEYIQILSARIKALEELNETVQISCNPPKDCNDPAVLKTYMKACFEKAMSL